MYVLCADMEQTILNLYMSNVRYAAIGKKWLALYLEKVDFLPITAYTIYIQNTVQMIKVHCIKRRDFHGLYFSCGNCKKMECVRTNC